MGARLAGVIGAVLVALAAAPAALAASTEVGANGNVFTGGLSFTPANISIGVGDAVRWRNTDQVVPHTATEDHNLWDLGGTYGATPANPPGFGPGATVERRFEAGTHSYYCKVHPTQMRGTIQVTPTLAVSRVRVRVKVRRKAHRRRAHRRRAHRRRARRTAAVRRRHRRRAPRTKVLSYVVAIWSTAAPDEGEVFDVEKRRVGAAWSSLATGTRDTNARFPAFRKSVWEVRARLRSRDDLSRATGWSPIATVSL